MINAINFNGIILIKIKELVEVASRYIYLQIALYNINSFPFF